MATSGKPTVNKKNIKYTEKNEDNVGNENGEDNVRSKKDKKKGMKLSRLRKKRLIVRNLSFKVNEEELKKVFSKFGEIVEVIIPLKSDGKKKGFAFVEFNNTKSMIKAMKELNFKKIQGRPVAIDFAVNKNTYLSHLNSSNSSSKRNSFKKEVKSEIETKNSDDESITDSNRNSLKEELKSEIEIDDSDDESIKCENESQETFNIKTESDDDEKVKAFLKEFDVDDDEQEGHSESEASEKSSEDDDDDDDDDDFDDSNYSKEHDNHNDSSESKPYKKRKSEDISEGKTVFIRNISFRNTEEELQETVEEFGETVYCLFCNDHVTGHFRGTAFVKFKEKESAEKLIEESSKLLIMENMYQTIKASEFFAEFPLEPGILLDGRKLLCAPAISREELSKQRDGSEKDRDKRNLRLLKCGLVAYGYKESEGVSQTDMAKRAQLEAVKKQKLKNVNFFVSDKRLVCHNIPKNINDKDLYKMFKKAAGEGAVIKEARIMKDFKKTDAVGNPMSRGFGFVTFTEHEHALKALNELNNNPNIFTASKRPIVEFSVENKVALLSQERRREKIKMLNKKRIEQRNNQNSERAGDRQSSDTVNIKFQKQKIQKKRKQRDINNPPNEARNSKKQRQHSDVNTRAEETVSPKKKKNQKKNRKKRKQNQQAQRKSEISTLTQMYKEKLLNKLS